MSFYSQPIFEWGLLVAISGISAVAMLILIVLLPSNSIETVTTSKQQNSNQQ